MHPFTELYIAWGRGNVDGNPTVHWNVCYTGFQQIHLVFFHSICMSVFCIAYDPYSISTIQTFCYQPIYSFHWARWLERCGHEHASFCQVSPGRLAVLLQAVQEGWSWPIHISWGKILHLCVSTVSVLWQFATFWWSAIILIKKGKI